MVEVRQLEDGKLDVLVFRRAAVADSGLSLQARIQLALLHRLPYLSLQLAISIEPSAY